MVYGFFSPHQRSELQVVPGKADKSPRGLAQALRDEAPRTCFQEVDGLCLVLALALALVLALALRLASGFAKWGSQVSSLTQLLINVVTTRPAEGPEIQWSLPPKMIP